MNKLTEKLEAALALECAADWDFYDEETRNQLGANKARHDMRAILRAIDRAGLRLAADKPI